MARSLYLSLALCLIPYKTAMCQTGIGGAAPVVLMEGALDCGGDCHTVDVFVDLSGLAGLGGDAGLNAFVLAFDLDRADVFASARPGTTPLDNWQFVATDRDLVGLTDRLILVGVAAEPNAPNQNYHLATVVLCGAPGNVTLSFIAAESSLGSRLVAGDGPGEIDMVAPMPLSLSILNPLSLDWGTGLQAWRMEAPAYDLASPMGAIDVRDLVKLNHCGLP